MCKKLYCTIDIVDSLRFLNHVLLEVWGIIILNFKAKLGGKLFYCNFPIIYIYIKSLLTYQFSM